MSSLSFGSWPSQIGTDALVAGELRLGAPAFADAGALIWPERRPAENGRTVLVRWTEEEGRRDLTPEGFDVRTRVHEYGGGAWWQAGRAIVFSEDSDGRLYLQRPGAAPVAISPEPPLARALRYADGCTSPDGRTIFCVRERHDVEGEAVNEIVSLALEGGEPEVLATGRDFYAAPRISPDGGSLAWLEWDHPRMPWDGTELALAGPDGSERRIVAGDETESIAAPAWSPDGELHFCSDRTDWWNVYRLREDGETHPVALQRAEVGGPAWVFGLRPFTFLEDGGIVCAIADGGRTRLGLIAAGEDRVRPLGVERTPAGLSVASDGTRVAYAGASPELAPAIVMIDPASGGEREIAAAGAGLAPELISTAREIEFTSQDGARAHALFYPPHNPAASAPEGELAPLVVMTHGGPTGNVTDELDLEVQFWTSRGFGVCDVNYGGSTGYGRPYRERLAGTWGIVDVADCVAAVAHLAELGEIDPARVAIRGGSAGGYTTLRALTTREAFAAGASLYGVGDLGALARDTHKFESRYLDGLIGPYPERSDLYDERSPINHVDGLSCPVILLQGLEDEVVPPAQAEQMVAALERKGIPHAYLAFEGEQHGFRRESTIRRAFEAELAFYGLIFGFEPADELPALELSGGTPA